ncbi:MAG: sulfonate transport system substrate-binding protein [Gaiellaceae bacterium]|jgi:ABC-type nitrate/sulfonate/bicarbonate transport system substrate-binding protein|nr:sulfonate transport system substrate-binding protein [Gaiellaceae bacterium]
MKAQLRVLGKARVIAVVALVALLAMASSGASAVRDKQAQLETVDIGHIASSLFLAVYVAEAKGYFAKQGIQPKFTTVGSATTVITGDVDLFISSLDTAIIDAGAGKPTPAIAIIQQRNALGLFVRADKAVTGKYPANVQKMKGFVVGTTRRASGADPFLLSTFGHAGLREGQDFTITALGTGPNLMAALQSKRIDAAMLFPPFDAQAVNQGLVKPVVQQALNNGPADVSQLYGSAVMANKEWLAKNPALAGRVVVALNQALRYLHDWKGNSRGIFRIAKQYTGITDDKALAQSLKMVSTLATNGLTCARLGVQVKLDTQYGLVGTKPSCDDVRDLKYLKSPAFYAKQNKK